MENSIKGEATHVAECAVARYASPSTSLSVHPFNQVEVGKYVRSTINCQSTYGHPVLDYFNDFCELLATSPMLESLCG